MTSRTSPRRPAYRSAGPSRLRARLRPKAEPVPDLRRDLLRGGGDVDLDGVRRRLQGFELAVQQPGVHEVPLAPRQAPADQLLRAAQVDVADALRVVPPEVLAVVVLQRRAGQHGVLPS